MWRVLLPLAISGLAGLCFSFFVTPRVIQFSHDRGYFDRPGERKVHERPIPRLGGMVILGSLILSLTLGVIALFAIGYRMDLRPFIGLIGGGVILVLFGLRDDLKGIKPRTKLIGQILAAGFAMLLGVRIVFFSNPLEGLTMLGSLGLPLTLLWLVGMTNAMNLIDGLDGLAAGVSIIAATTMAIVALQLRQLPIAVLLLGMVGGTLGFLWFNFHPAKIFLGDSGSMLLGFILAGAAVAGVLKSTLFLSLLIPVLVLGVPIFDTAHAIIRRGLSGRNIFEADMGHLHHRLLQSGLTHRRTVIFIYLDCVLLSIGAYLVTLVHSLPVFILVALLFVVAWYFMYRIKLTLFRTT